MYRIEISSFEKYIDTFRYQQKIKRYDIISIYRPTLALATSSPLTYQGIQSSELSESRYYVVSGI